MNTKNETEKTEPRKLEKPVSKEQEMKKEELVTYVSETTSSGSGLGNGPG